MQRFRRLLTTLIAGVLLLGPAAYVVLNRVEIMDWWALRNYEPPAAIAQLAKDTTMTEYGRRIFYVNSPELLDKGTFYVKCNQDEVTIILGCYTGKDGIYVLDVTDERLKGVEQVTAAHEMLHAAYDRLGNAEKTKIDKEIDRFYRQLDNESLREKVRLYNEAGADVINELHSILPTEIEELSPVLEEYYKKYFSERVKIAQYATAYQGLFTQRKAQLEAYNEELSQLEAQIEVNNKQLDDDAKSLQAEQDRLNALLAANDIATYNAGVNPFNLRVRNYNSLVAQTKSLIDSYKAKLAERNKVAEEAQQLSKALDSRITTREQL